MPHHLEPAHADQAQYTDRAHRDTESQEVPAVGEPVPLSVWLGAQRPAAVQRRGRYVPGSTAHPGKMLPDVAAAAITAYTRPGELVLDPMCGIGTTLVEAVHLGRTAVGIEVEPRWAALARANLDLAQDQGACGSGAVITADARNARALLADPALTGGVALLLTSPPYGDSVHGQVRSSRDSGQSGVRKSDYTYGRHPHNLARGGHQRLLSGFTDILASCLPLLRPGAIVAITTRPYRRHGRLVDFPAHVWDAAQGAGLEPVQRLAALLCGIKDDRLVTRASFFALHETRKARAAGLPLHATAHEEVLILRRPPEVPQPGKPILPGGEPGAAAPSAEDGR
jgi:modification methylase